MSLADGGRRGLLWLAVAQVAPLALGCTDPVAKAPAVTPTETPGFEARLRGIAGVRVQDAEVLGEGVATFYRLTVTQPVDHTHPESGSFEQRLTLLVGHVDAPVVLHTSGYYAWQEASAWEVTALLGANQIDVEHRHFPPSRPSPPAWEQLNVAQSAADFHRIVEALRPLFKGKWISTGESKGGLTALLHRRSFPADVEATVAYVAPIMTSDYDNRFLPFVTQLGTVECRERLRRFQRAALGQRVDVEQVLAGLAAAKSLPFNRLGLDRAYEFSVLELPFFLWQTKDAATCDAVPAEDANPTAVLLFIDSIVHIFDNFSDPGLEAFDAYWQQAASELGAPALADEHLADLLRYPGEDRPHTYAPAAALATYRPEPAANLIRWIETRGERLLLVYGENDPWTAGAANLGNAKDSFRFTVPSGNHFVQLSDLPAADRSIAFDALERWSGAAVQRLTETPSLALQGQLHRDAKAMSWHLRGP